MTNLAEKPAYLETLETAETAYQAPPVRESKKQKQKLSAEDMEIIEALNAVKRDMECLHNRYDQATDPLLTDSIIYELKAAHIKYKYFLNKCKEKGIIGGI